jgi:hypothetical protein
MDLRQHETNPKLTIATHEDQAEAAEVALAVAPFYKKPLYYLGLYDGIKLNKDPSLTILDDGRIELEYKTKRLARFAGQLIKESASHLAYRPEEVYAQEKKTQALSDTITHYLSGKTMSLPTYQARVEPEPTPNELARTEAYKKLETSKTSYFGASALAMVGGLSVAGVGRIVEVLSVNPNIPDHVNETVRQIGNDISYGGLASAGIGLAISAGIIRGLVRNERNFDAGWREATNRLDPDSRIEASLQTELQQEPTELL